MKDTMRCIVPKLSLRYSLLSTTLCTCLFLHQCTIYIFLQLCLLENLILTHPFRHKFIFTYPGKNDNKLPHLNIPHHKAIIDLLSTLPSYVYLSLDIYRYSGLRWIYTVTGATRIWRLYRLLLFTKDGFCYSFDEALDSLLCFFSGDTTSNKTCGRSIGYALPQPATC